VILIQRAQVLRYQITPARLARELARLERAGRVRASNCWTFAAASRGGAAGDGVALRRSAVDARRSDARAPRGGNRPPTAGQRRLGVQQIFEEFSAVFDEVADPTCGNAKAMSPIWSVVSR